jgi:hypothetical protein
MFEELKEINSRPGLFEFYTADELWTNEHTAEQMLQYFSPETLEKELVKSGFMVEKLYSDVAGTPFNADSTEIAVVATTS